MTGIWITVGVGLLVYGFLLFAWGYDKGVKETEARWSAAVKKYHWPERAPKEDLPDAKRPRRAY
jgi:hypothetical protein